MNIDFFKTKLEAELSELETELKSIGIHDPSDPLNWEAIPEEDTGGNEPDENDAADEVEEWNARRAELSLLETRYNNIAKALAKIASGNFGQCEVCGAEIEEARLEVSPSARTCVTHKEDETTLTN